MKNIESGFQSDDAIESSYENDELVDTENPGKILDRDFTSLDESEAFYDVRNKEATAELIKGVEDKYPELTKFAPEQYC